MKTRDEILATWETEGRYTDWCAIDSYNPIDSTIRRLFVGTEQDATDMMKAYYIDATDKALQPFYRISYISPNEARDYFEGKVYELPDERGFFSATEAAEMLGVSRMRVNQLLNNGKLEGKMVDGTWRVYRYSVENRLEESMKHRA